MDRVNDYSRVAGVKRKNYWKTNADFGTSDERKSLSPPVERFKPWNKMGSCFIKQTNNKKINPINAFTARLAPNWQIKTLFSTLFQAKIFTVAGYCENFTRLSTLMGVMV